MEMYGKPGKEQHYAGVKCLGKSPENYFTIEIKKQKSQRIVPFLKIIQNIPMDFIGAKALGFFSCSALAQLASSS